MSEELPPTLPLYGPDAKGAVEVQKYIRENAAELRSNWARKREESEKSVEVIRTVVAGAANKRLPGLCVIWDAAAYMNIASLDLAVLGESLMFDEVEWRRRHHARHAALLMFELFDDYSSMLGKEFRTAVSKLPDGQAILDDLDARSKGFNRIRGQFSSVLKLIREYSVAHRDHSGVKQLEVIYHIQPTVIFRLCAEVDSLMNEVGAVLQRALLSSADNHSLFQDDEPDSA
jgi:hypothetical protein